MEFEGLRMKSISADLWGDKNQRDQRPQQGPDHRGLIVIIFIKFNPHNSDIVGSIIIII